MAQIVLDAEAFKALSSETRLQILKALDARRLTVSELGRLLDLNKATVFEHLKQLLAADLVKKVDEGRKWVYYKLTWKGSNVLHPENVQFMLLLGTAVLSVGGIVATLGNLLAWWGGGSTSSAQAPGPPAPTTGAEDAPRSPQGAGAPASSSPPATTPAMADQTGPGGGPPASGARAEGGPWDDPNLWLLVLLSVLVLVAAWFGVRWHLQRSRSRREMRRRLAALPPAPPDDAGPA